MDDDRQHREITEKKNVRKLVSPNSKKENEKRNRLRILRRTWSVTNFAEAAFLKVKGRSNHFESFYPPRSGFIKGFFVVGDDPSVRSHYIDYIIYT